MASLTPSNQQSCDEADLAESDWEVEIVLATGSSLDPSLDPGSASRSTSISRVKYKTLSIYIMLDVL